MTLTASAPAASSEFPLRENNHPPHTTQTRNSASRALASTSARRPRAFAAAVKSAARVSYQRMTSRSESCMRGIIGTRPGNPSPVPVPRLSPQLVLRLVASRRRAQLVGAHLALVTDLRRLATDHRAREIEQDQRQRPVSLEVRHRLRFDEDQRNARIVGGAGLRSRCPLSRALFRLEPDAPIGLVESADE